MTDPAPALLPDVAAPAGAEWWRARAADLLTALGDRGALYAYSRDIVRRQIKALLGLSSVDRLFYSMKANSHPGILSEVEAAQAGFECVSWEEVQAVRDQFPAIAVNRILFTPNFAPRREYEAAIAAGVRVTLDSLYPLEAWPEIFSGAHLILRVDPKTPRGHHRYVQTAGDDTKFGIGLDEFERAVALCRTANAVIDGLHAHAGSGVRDPQNWVDLATFLMPLVSKMDSIRFLNLGGGHGIVDRPGTAALDLGALDAALGPLRAQLPGIEFWFEPGRFIVGEAGVLLARVTQVKSKGTHRYVGVETGMNSLIRPALYGAHHEIVNLSRLNEATLNDTVTVVGPICESADVLGKDVKLPTTREGDVLLIANAGAYGRAMSSHYNMRAPAPEAML